MPAKKTARRQRLQLLKNEIRTVVFYEAPHRILACIEDAIICFGSERQAVVAKEITKLHENIKRATLADILKWLNSDRDLCKGEFVVVIQGDKADQFNIQEANRILKILLADHSVKEASKLTSEIMQGNRNDIYKLAMDLKAKE